MLKPGVTRCAERPAEDERNIKRPWWRNLLCVLWYQCDDNRGNTCTFEIVSEPANCERTKWSDRNEDQTINLVAPESFGKAVGCINHTGRG